MILVSKITFEFNLRRFNKGTDASGTIKKVALSTPLHPSLVGWCRLTLSNPR
jgi:hypothetical protein